jgi:hypothetical protein
MWKFVLAKLTQCDRVFPTNLCTVLLHLLNLNFRQGSLMKWQCRLTNTILALWILLIIVVQQVARNIRDRWWALVNAVMNLRVP